MQACYLHVHGTCTAMGYSCSSLCTLLTAVDEQCNRALFCWSCSNAAWASQLLTLISGLR